MVKKNNFINCYIRKYSYGGIMDVLIKVTSLSTFFKRKIRVIELDVNPKKKGGLLIRNVKDKNSYKNLFYEKKDYLIKDFESYLQKYLLIIRIFCVKYSFFSILIKAIFVLFNLNFKIAKKNFSVFFNEKKIFDANYNSSNLNYLKSIGLNLNPGDFQKCYLNRKSFEILNEEQERKIIENKNIFNFDRNFFCFYLREQEYDTRFTYLDKRDDVIWYNSKDFEKALINLINREFMPVNIGFENTKKLNHVKYFDLKLNDLNSEKINYIFAKNSKFFLSTGGGKSDLAKLFKKPILRVDHAYNVINNFDFSTESDHIIFCHVYCKNKKRFLSIKEQFQSLNKLFPSISHGKIIFNKEDFLLVKNTEEEILELTKNFSFQKNKIEEQKINQSEVFEIKQTFVKKNMPDYFLKLSTNYPKNPLICKSFFNKNHNYSEYLEEKTINFNKQLFK